MAHKAARSAGFTLIEMMVVIAIMGLLLLLLLGRGPARSPTLTLRAAASEVAEALRSGRSRAIASDAPVPFLIAPAAHAFGIARSMHGLPAGVALSVVTRPVGPIVFQPDGSASAGAVHLVLGNLEATVRVDWLTGRVSVDPVRAVAEN